MCLCVRMFVFLCVFQQFGLEGAMDERDPIYPTPPLGQDMTQGQFLSEV